MVQCGENWALICPSFSHQLFNLNTDRNTFHTYIYSNWILRHTATESQPNHCEIFGSQLKLQVFFFECVIRSLLSFRCGYDYDMGLSNKFSRESCYRDHNQPTEMWEIFEYGLNINAIMESLILFSRWCNYVNGNYYHWIFVVSVLFLCFNSVGFGMFCFVSFNHVQLQCEMPNRMLYEWIHFVTTVFWWVAFEFFFLAIFASFSLWDEWNIEIMAAVMNLLNQQIWFINYVASIMLNV